MRLALALALCLTLVGCGASTVTRPGASGSSSSSPSPAPSASTPPSAEPTAEPSPSIVPSPAPSSDAADALETDSIAVVVTNNLRVRSKPRVADDSARLTPLLDKGRTMFVVDGPVEASGLTWYQVVPIRFPSETRDLPFGWVAAAGKDGEPWLSGEGFTCPARPATYAAMTAMSPFVGLSCFGDRDLSFAARIADPEATCGIDLGWTIEPVWLAGTCPQPPFLLEDPERTDLSRNAVVDPDLDVSRLRPGPEPAEWLAVVVTGHFDHPEARSCHGVSTDQPVPPSAAEIVASCRATFVISAIEKSA